MFKDVEKKSFMDLVEEYQAVKNCSVTEAMQHCTKKFPEKRREYLEAANEGRGRF